MNKLFDRRYWPAWLGVTILCAQPASAGAASSSAEQNWPQWRGPLQTGVAPSANPPLTWSETNHIKWKVKIPGDGTATPIIWDNQVFVQTAVPTGKKSETTATPNETGPGGRPASGLGEPPGSPGGGTGRGPGGRGRFGGGSKPGEPYQFVILCLDRKTGKILWQQVAREEVPHEGVRDGDGSFAATSGLTDGHLVFAYFGSRGLYCYDLNGKLLWNRDLGKMRVQNGFGEGSSPTLYKDALIVNWDNEDGSFILALDKNTGKTLWKEARDERTSWSTPLIVEHDGNAQVVTTATGKIRSYDVANGKLLWECAGLTRNVIPSPVADGEKVYCTSGFQGNALLAIKLGHSGDLTGTDAIAWTHKKSTPYVPSPLLYGGRIYFLQKNDELLSCLDSATGKPLLDAERIDDLRGMYASPLGAAGRIYLASRNGATVVLKQSGKLEKLATNRLEDKFDASPAAVGNDLFLRGREFLYCIAEK